jgi:hypothetical protein
VEPSELFQEALNISLYNYRESAQGDLVNQEENTMSNYYTQAEAVEAAAKMTSETGKLHIATDSGEWVWPRYSAIAAPAVGDLVSYAFNGDSYPCGTIVSVSKSLRVVKTSTGETFYRRQQSGTWKKEGGTWSLISGHHNERNPSF